MLYGVGTLIWTYYELVKHCACPFPSCADAGYLLSYLSLAIGILLLPSRRLPSALRGRVLMDSLMIMTAVVTFSWYFILGPTLQQASESLWGKILGAGYPLGDLVLLFCLLLLTGREQTPEQRASARFVGAGLALIIIADAIFGYLTLKGAYQTGFWIDVGWPAGYMLIAAGAYTASQIEAVQEDVKEPSALDRNPVLWRSLLPYLFVPALAALLLYTLHHHGDESLEAGVYFGSALLLGMLLLRQIFAMLENARLNSFLQAAYRELEDNNTRLAEANARLERMATTDGMTGLANHRAFQERLRTELEAGREKDEPLSLLLLDVDRFKQYNDAFGHPAGDEALRILARILGETVGECGQAARYGGEEFAVLLPGAGLKAGLTMAERIRKRVEATEFPHRRVTVSIGVTSMDVCGDQPETLIANADAGLYAAKQAGRNRAVSSGVSLAKAA